MVFRKTTHWHRICNLERNRIYYWLRKEQRQIKLGLQLWFSFDLIFNWGCDHCQAVFKWFSNLINVWNMGNSTHVNDFWLNVSYFAAMIPWDQEPFEYVKCLGYALLRVEMLQLLKQCCALVLDATTLQFCYWLLLIYCSRCVLERQILKVHSAKLPFYRNPLTLKRSHWQHLQHEDLYQNKTGISYPIQAKSNQPGYIRNQILLYGSVTCARGLFSEQSVNR